MTANELVNDFGFKRITRNKEKLLSNMEYGITIRPIIEVSNHFVDINTNEEYRSIGDIITKIAKVGIERDSDIFHRGLPDINLKQGNFNEAYKVNTQKQEFFITHEKAKRLLEAQFNWHISGALMSSSGEPNYNYFIKECKYEFKYSESNNITTLTLSYNYKDRRGNHDFWMTHDIYNFDKDNYPINRRVGSYVPLDLILNKFLK